MSDLSDLPCTTTDCGCDCDAPLERLRYFPRQLMTADDMRAEQHYFREKARRHNRYLHGWGVSCGCTVEAVTSSKPGAWQVRVCPGYAVAPQGDAILIDDCIDVDLQLGPQNPPCSVRWPCPPTGEMPGVDRERGTTAYIAVRYAECFSRPVRVHPSGCGCDETGCEYSRVRDSFEIKVLWELPASHRQARLDDEQWCQTVRTAPPELLKRLHTFPVPPCPPCPSDPWVVLATVRIPPPGQGNIAGGAPAALQISYEDRRVLLATQRLQVAALCLP
jgi:hypothetical protein